MKSSLSYLVKFKGIRRSVQLIAIAQLSKLRIDARFMKIHCAAILFCIFCIFVLKIPVYHAQSMDLVIVSNHLPLNTALRMEMWPNYSMFECGIDMYGDYIDYDMYRPRIRLVNLNNYCAIRPSARVCCFPVDHNVIDSSTNYIRTSESFNLWMQQLCHNYNGTEQPKTDMSLVSHHQLRNQSNAFIFERMKAMSNEILEQTNSQYHVIKYQEVGDKPLSDIKEDSMTDNVQSKITEQSNMNANNNKNRPRTLLEFKNDLLHAMLSDPRI
jgi:hypothetical protein